MLDSAIGTAISFIVSGALGYAISLIKTYRGRDKNQDEALRCLLRSAITSKYYIYKDLGKIPHYEKENLNYLAKCYFAMGGNSYVAEIMKEINNLPLA